MTANEKKELQIAACKVRMGVIQSTHAAKAGHPGGSLSAADLFAYLYCRQLNVDPADPRKQDRDRFVLSKGHCAPGLYSALALRGFFPWEDLKTLRHIGSYLQGHPDMKSIPGVDMSTGSLGQGISAACGMALAAKKQNNPCRKRPHCPQRQPKSRAAPAGYIPCWGTARSRRARCGRP